MNACRMRLSRPIEAERFDHGRLELGAVFFQQQRKSAAVAVDPGCPNESTRFGLLADVADPACPFGIACAARRTILSPGSEFTQDDAVRRHAMISRPTGDAIEALRDRAAVEGGPAIALEALSRV